MYSHVMVGTDDLEASKAFYDALFATLDVKPATVSGERMFYRNTTGMFGVTKPINGQPASLANGGTIAFACNSTDQADKWHAAGLANGGTTCEDPPGYREGAFGKLYLAYLRDPDGNKLCAIHRG